ncbi:MAG TPA: site-specific DNA-methyltransferase [Longimicrobiaceae bacterium]
MRPYYKDESVVLYHGDWRDAAWLRGDLIIADPPYGETSLDWDRWPSGWPGQALPLAPQMWCFGSFRMFWDRSLEFDGWKLAQEVIWEKHNGSGFHADRFKRVHEVVAHFYTGAWGDLYLAPVTTPDATKRTIRRKRRPPHTGRIEAGSYASEDGGPRLMRSVIQVRSCHGRAINETQKPEGIVRPLIEYSCPPGGTVISLFAGSGTDLLVAKELGRKAIGFEVREGQCEGAARRLSQEVPALGGAA